MKWMKIFKLFHNGTCFRKNHDCKICVTNKRKFFQPDMRIVLGYPIGGITKEQVN